MPNTSSAHDSHDTLLLAAFAAGDLPDAAAADAARLVATCTACAELVADLRSIAQATAALPAPRRRRDFRLSEADAARLRGPWWRRALTTLAAPRFAFARPLAATLTTLGVAGLLLASVPTTQVGTTAFAPAAGTGAADMAAPAATAAPSEASAPRVGVAAPNPSSGSVASSAAPEANPAGTMPPPAPSTLAAPPSGPAALAVPVSPGPETVTGGGPNRAYSNASPEPLSNTQAAGGSSKSAGGQAIAPMEAGRDSSGGGFELPVSPLALLSLAFLAVGLGLFALRWTGRRLMGG